MRSKITLFIAVLILAGQAALGAVTGKYSDGNLTIDLSGSDTLSGTIALGANQFPVTAHANGNSVDGTFSSSGNAFPFTATLDGDTLTLVSGGKTYTLKRIEAQVNPLGDSANSASPAAAPAIGGYSVVTSTDFGKAMFAQKSDVDSVRAALGAAIPDLTQFFDSQPEIKGAYEDSKDHKSGGLTFAATLKGEAMKGVVSCKLLDKGAAVTIVYCRLDAPQAEWAKLYSPQAPAAPASGDAAPAAEDFAKVLGDNAQVVQFADGTGSITVPDGWKATAQSALSPVHVQGPADQDVIIGSSIAVSAPDSQLVRMVQQNQQRMRQMGMRPSAPPQMMIAKFTDPVQAMEDIWPQLSKISQARGGPAIHLDQIVDHKDIPVQMEGVKAAVITFDVTRTTNGVAKQYRGMVRATMIPLANGTWSLSTTGITAPADTFASDRRLMFAIVQSEKLNQSVIMQRMNEQNEQQMAMIRQQGEASAAALQANHDAFMKAQDQRFATHEAQMAQTQAGYDAHNQQFQDYELQRSRNKDNVVEQTLGYREVYDTQTGLSSNVDLNNVTGVVNALNDAALDPNRFVQIPLRDLQDPK